MDNDLFNFIVSVLIDRAKEAAEESGNDSNDKFKAGKEEAYYEVLDIIRNRLMIYDYDLSECGLEEDPMLMMGKYRHKN